MSVALTFFPILNSSRNKLIFCAARVASIGCCFAVDDAVACINESMFSSVVSMVVVDVIVEEEDTCAFTLACSSDLKVLIPQILGGKLK